MFTNRMQPFDTIETSDFKQLEIQQLPDGRWMFTTWVSRKAPQSYFVLNDAMWNTVQEVIENATVVDEEFVRLYCGRIGNHPNHVWVMQDDKKVMCLGVDPYTILDKLQNKEGTSNA